MRTIQMTLEENLISEVDKVVKLKKTTRSAFTREALQAALINIQEKEMEQKQIKGYIKKPVKAGEFGPWESEQVWVD
jgi:metal-responsive CopG/Arc/MetJ family transcriptional regulator